LVAGALPEAERAALANHAASCDRCHVLIEALVETGGPYATTPASDKLPASGDGHATGVLVLGRGTRVGRYVIEAPLGAGGMSVVHAALDPELHRQVAVKLLRPARHGQAGSDERDRVMREARALARLSHPNVVTVFDAGAHHGHPFVVMELVDGGSLSAWLRRAPRTTEETIDCLLGAGRGLAAAHAAGVVHRDVKPDNILVGLDGRARVTDFGLAQLGGVPFTPEGATSLAMRDPPLGSTQTGTVMGTPAYMAPEQWRRGQTDARSDQWSFCATLYEALAGVRPFVMEGTAARSSAIAEGRLAAPAPGRHVPGWVRQIVMRGLRADPSARWPSMDAVVHALALGRRRHATRARSRGGGTTMPCKSRLGSDFRAAHARLPRVRHWIRRSFIGGLRVMVALAVNNKTLGDLVSTDLLFGQSDLRGHAEMHLGQDDVGTQWSPYMVEDYFSV